MAQLLALEYGGGEVRAAVASRRAGQAVIEQAFSIPLPSPPSAEGQPNLDIGQQIAEVLQAKGIGPLDAIIAVGRGGVELRQLQLPAATDEELPQMVRFQAMTEFNEFDERWLLDFVPIDVPGGNSRTVLAAAVAPSVVERVQEICQRCGLRLRHLVLRSCAAAALLARGKTAPRGQSQLLVELLPDQADLTVTIDGKAIFLRTMRLAADRPLAQSLVTEIRLTMAAVQNQLGGRRVAKIVLCGRGEADVVLAKQIEKDTATSTVVWDPFTGLKLSPQLRASPVERPGRFAAVLGMAMGEFDRAGHAIDFLYPRHIEAPTNPRKKWIGVAIAAALLALAYLVYGRIAYWQLEEEVRGLETRLAAADNTLSRGGTKTLALANEIAKWADGQVECLDQLRQLSADFPPAEQAAVGRLTISAASASAGAEAYGRIQLEGWAKDNKAVTDMEQRLRAHARVEGSKSNEDRTVSPYTLKFNTTVLIAPGSKP